MIPEKFFESTTPKKVNSANLPPGKIYLKIETPGKNHNQGTPGFLCPYPCTDKKWNSPFFYSPRPYCIPCTLEKFIV